MNTMQEEFDAVVAHLFKQGRPAKDSTSTVCLYRSEDGKLSCAVGCRIPDAVYDPQMDVPDRTTGGTVVRSLIERFRDVLPPEIPAYKSMFEALQNVHDSCLLTGDGSFDRIRLGNRLRDVAEEFKLTFTVPTPANG